MRKNSLRCRSFKKGNVGLDTLVVVFVVISLAIMGVIGYKTFDDMNTDIQNDAQMNDESKAVSAGFFAKYPTLMDNIFLFCLVLLVLFLIVSVFLLDTHPIFFFISTIILIMVFIVCLAMGNFFDDLMTDAEFSPYANNMPYTAWIMSHILQLMLAVGFIVSIALYSKLKR